MSNKYDYAGGWGPILNTFSEYLDNKYQDKTRPVHSWKEKYGTLRIDFRGGFDSEDHSIANFCEELSSRICEECGKPGEPKDGSWIKTLCNDCNNIKYGGKFE